MIVCYILFFELFDVLMKCLDELWLVWGKVCQFGKDVYMQLSVEGWGIFVEVDDGFGGIC